MRYLRQSDYETVEEEPDEIRKRGGSDSEGRERGGTEEEREEEAGRENSGRNLDVITLVYRVNSRLVIAIYPAGFSYVNGLEITLASFCELIRREFPR